MRHSGWGVVSFSVPVSILILIWFWFALRLSWGWSKCSDAFLLSFVSDNATANMKLIKWLPHFLPANALIVNHLCNGPLGLTDTVTDTVYCMLYTGYWILVNTVRQYLINTVFLPHLCFGLYVGCGPCGHRSKSGMSPTTQSTNCGKDSRSTNCALLRVGTESRESWAWINFWGFAQRTFYTRAMCSSIWSCIAPNTLRRTSRLNTGRRISTYMPQTTKLMIYDYRL